MKNNGLNKSLRLMLTGALIVLVSNANASLIDGVGVFTSIGNASNCPSYCTSANGGDFTYNSAGEEGATNAYAELNDYAYGQAYANIVAGSFLPILRVEANAQLGKKSSAMAWAVQNFINIGSETKRIDLNVNLHGSVGSNSSGYQRNVLSAAIAIISGTTLEWYPDFGTLVYEFARPLMSPTSLFISNGVDRNVAETISFDIGAGESFFIVSEMRASSQNGYADAWNTLSMDFQDGSNLQAALQPATVNVPEPETMFLLMFGLIGVLLGKRTA